MLKVHTNVGDFTVTLDHENAPETAKTTWRSQTAETAAEETKEHNDKPK